MKHEIVIRGLDNIGQAAEQFLTETAGHTIIAFYAPMGAGKTTFTTALCHRLGVNEYRTSGGDSIYHFDFYRITRVEEAFDIGLYDYLDSGSLCLIEWPENIEQILPEETLKVTIKVLPDESRVISWED